VKQQLMGKCVPNVTSQTYFSLFEIAAYQYGNSNNSKPIICVGGNLSR